MWVCAGCNWRRSSSPTSVWAAVWRGAEFQRSDMFLAAWRTSRALSPLTAKVWDASVSAQTRPDVLVHMQLEEFPVSVMEDKKIRARPNVCWSLREVHLSLQQSEFVPKLLWQLKKSRLHARLNKFHMADKAMCKMCWLFFLLCSFLMRIYWRKSYSASMCAVNQILIKLHKYTFVRADQQTDRWWRCS